MIQFNANKARELAKEGNTTLLQATLDRIKERSEEGHTNYDIFKEQIPGGLRIKLRELGFEVSGLINNGGTKKITISWG